MPTVETPHLAMIVNKAARCAQAVEDACKGEGLNPADAIQVMQAASIMTMLDYHNPNTSTHNELMEQYQKASVYIFGVLIDAFKEHNCGEEGCNDHDNNNKPD